MNESPEVIDAIRPCAESYIKALNPEGLGAAAPVTVRDHIPGQKEHTPALTASLGVNSP